MKNGILILLAILIIFLGCEKGPSPTQAWKYGEMGRFKAVTIEDLSKNDQEKLATYLNHSLLSHSFLLVPNKHYIHPYEASRFFGQGREIYYLCDLDENIEKLTYSGKAKAVNFFEFFEDQKSTAPKLTQGHFYHIRYDKSEDGYHYSYHTYEKVKGEMQSRSPYKTSIDRYRKSNSLGLPNIGVRKEGQISQKTLIDYRKGNLTERNVDSVWHWLVEDTVFNKPSENPAFQIIDERGHLVKFEQTSKDREHHSHIQYDSLDRVKQVLSHYSAEGYSRKQKNPRVFYDTLDFVYEAKGLLLSREKANWQVGEEEIKDWKRDDFTYQLFYSDKQFTKAIVTLTTTDLKNQTVLSEFVNEFFFDPRMNWIKIIRSNGEENRRIWYD